MHRIVFICLALAAFIQTRAAEFRIGPHTFTVPDGFEVEQVAGADLVLRPVSASFDDRGRLYVTDSSGSNKPPPEQLKNPDHRVLRLEDTDGDGRFDRSTVFADKVMFPQGCLWHDGSVYVAGPPSIWKFTDTDGDGVADRREEWFKGGSLTGCANDIHGPHLGPEGFLYWTKGAFAEQTHTLGNGRVLRDKAAHIYRARPDGSGLDVVMTGGMDNPVEVAFLPDGEAVFTSTFIDFSQPGFRDGIAHAAYGAVFGKENDVLNDRQVKRAGPALAHPFHQAGPSAECGLMRYEGTAFGPEYRDNLFATAFNLRKVTRHVLRPEGATYASTDRDFLVGDHPDFRPTDVLEDADGSLLVVDTGGWYKLCCPSSQLAKADVLGAIYRVSKRGAKRLPPFERGAAYARLAQPPALSPNSEVVRIKRAMWDGRPDENDRWLRWFNDHLGSKRNESSPQVLRALAEHCGRARFQAAIPALFQAIQETPLSDPTLETALIRALIDIADVPLTRTRLSSTPFPRQQRAALIALDQMDGGDLTPPEVVPFLNARDERLREAANWVLRQHPGWGADLAGWFREQLVANQADEPVLQSLHSQFDILTRAEAGQRLLASVVTGDAFASSSRVAALRTIGNAGLRPPPREWTTAIREVVTVSPRPSPEGPVMMAALEAARTVSTDSDVRAALAALAEDDRQDATVRLAALAALPSGTRVSDAQFALLRGRLQPDVPPVERSRAADSIARLQLSEVQLERLADTLTTAGPIEIAKLLTAFDGSSDAAVGLALVRSLKESPSARALTPGQISPHLVKFPEVVRTEARDFLASLDAAAAGQSAHLDALLAELKSLRGDIRRGQAVFNSPRTACLTCHQIGYLGGTLGPDLTRIGQIRTERDLLEAVLYPSASFVRSYEPVIVARKDGEEFSGLVKKDDAREIILATGPGVEQRIARDDVVAMKPGAVSVMPAGLDQQLSKQELADLLAFLKGTQWGPN